MNNQNHNNNDIIMNQPNLQREEIVNAYLERDIELNLDSPENRVKNLNKLGYTIEKINEYKNKKQQEYIMNYVANRYNEYIHNNFEIGYMNFGEIINNYENSQEYQRVEQRCNEKLQRYNVLSQYIDGTNFDFYNALTRDELIYLGW